MARHTHGELSDREPSGRRNTLWERPAADVEAASDLGTGRPLLGG
jgi:hypothetical protein